MHAEDPIVRQAYDRLQALFPGQVLGLLQIGSRANDEAVADSDWDLRAVIRTEAPYRVFADRAWVPPVEVKTEPVAWSEINDADRVTCGLTNLGYVEAHLTEDRFPLADHTALYQGALLLDPDGQVQAFRARHAGRFFADVAEAYRRQTEWRLQHRLAGETAPDQLAAGLDPRKKAVPALHTGCRILRDLAQIDTYRRQHTYLAGFAELDAYYHERWPEEYDWFRMLFAYKMDEVERRNLFVQIERSEPAGLAVIEKLSNRVNKLWQHFDNV